MGRSTFRDRVDAGAALAECLADRRGNPDLIVLGLPRGGVPVAAVVASALDAPLDICVVRKLGAPGHAELAIGAVASGEITVRNEQIIEQLRIRPEVFDEVRRRELAEVARREQSLRGGRPPLDVAGKDVVVVDDGLATGATMTAAVRSIGQRRARTVTVAVPVGAAASVVRMKEIADDVVCAVVPDRFGAVGSHYLDFTQTSDEEVRRLLDPRRSYDT